MDDQLRECRTTRLRGRALASTGHSSRWYSWGNCRTAFGDQNSDLLPELIRGIHQGFTVGRQVKTSGPPLTGRGANVSFSKTNEINELFLNFSFFDLAAVTALVAPFIHANRGNFVHRINQNDLGKNW